MAGQLDLSPDQWQALTLLGSGVAAGNAPGGFQAASSLLADAPMKAKRMSLLDGQLADMQAQAEERKQKMEMQKQAQEMQQRLLYGDAGGQGGAGFMPSGGQAAPSGVGQAQGGGGIMALAQKFGIPPQAIQADIAFNGGKKVSELLAKHGSRDMQVTNGYAYDKNNLGPGFMPFLNTSNTGQTSMGRIGPDGLPVVSAPQGALETYRAYKGADAGIAAETDLVSVDLPGGPQQMTRAQALKMTQQRPAQQQPGGVQQQIGGGQRLTPELQAAILRDAAANGDGTPPRTAFTGAGPNQAYGWRPSNGANPSVPGFALKPKATKGQETVDAEFGKDYAAFVAGGGSADISKQLEQLKVAAKAMTADSGVSGPYVGRIPDNLRTLTEEGRKAVNARELVLESVQRNLRIVLGAQFTEKEGEKLMSRAFNPLLGPEENQRRTNRLIEQIGTAAETKADAARYFEQNGTLAGWQGKLPTFNDFSPEGSPGKAEPKTFSQLPPASQYKGKVATNPATGQRMRSNGLSWVEEK